MSDKIFDISFDYNGMHFTGWVNPSSKKSEGAPSSFHVVLNDIFFGNLSFNQGKWINSEDRPDGLTTLTGEHIEAYLKKTNAL